MKLISPQISFVIYSLLSITLVSSLFFYLQNVFEKSQISSIYMFMFEQFRILDRIILQLNSLDVGSKIRVKISIPEGRLVIREGKIIYELESSDPMGFLKEIVRTFENILVSFKNISFVCEIRNNSCSENETCVFSLYKMENSHIGDCEKYSYKVCCKNINFRISPSCREDEGEIVRLFKNENSHAGFEKYSLRICSYPAVKCSLKGRCDKNEICVVSFYKDLNSHAAVCNYYNNNLCCYTSYTEKGEMVLSYVDIEIIGELILVKGNYEIILEKIGENRIRIIL